MKAAIHSLAHLMILILVTNALSQDDFFMPESSIGGYGELHYNANQTSDSKTLDFHRFVLFYGHQWTPKWSFNAEVELEHNFVKDGQGELELEQAFVDFHPNAYFGFRAGVVLPSAGLLNERHEPPLFLSVERPEYAKNIIPTTWFGNGAAIYGFANGFDYQFTVMEGLNADKFSASSGIRGGRQKGYKANAEHLLYNGRVDYVGVNGLRVGLSVTMNKAFSATGNDIGLSLLEFHAKYDANDIISVFEFGNISYDEGPLEASQGYYFDLGYNIGSFLNTQTQLIPWVRISDYNPAHTTRAGGDSEKANHISKWMIGFTVKPIAEVVFKIDYGVSTVELNDQEIEVLNIGAGYMF